MKSDVKLPNDPAKRPISPKVSPDPYNYSQFKAPSRVRRKKTYDGPTTSIYNNNFTKMPKDF